MTKRLRDFYTWSKSPHNGENIRSTTCLVKRPAAAAVAVAPYPDVVVELLVTKGGPTDVFVVEPPALGLAHMAHVREFCLAFFRGFRNNWRETGRFERSLLLCTYRDRLKGLYMVARYFFLLMLNFSAWPCLAVA